MLEGQIWIFSVSVVFILAMFLIAMWNDARHHHRWGKWGEPKIVGVIVNGVSTGGQVRFQERYCETCGSGESRRME